jgi:hypothetical protein
MKNCSSMPHMSISSSGIQSHCTYIYSQSVDRKIHFIWIFYHFLRQGDQIGLHNFRHFCFWHFLWKLSTSAAQFFGYFFTDKVMYILHLTKYGLGYLWGVVFHKYIWSPCNSGHYSWAHRACTYMCMKAVLHRLTIDAWLNKKRTNVRQLCKNVTFTFSTRGQVYVVV